MEKQKYVFNLESCSSFEEYKELYNEYKEAHDKAEKLRLKLYEFAEKRLTPEVSELCLLKQGDIFKCTRIDSNHTIEGVLDHMRVSLYGGVEPEFLHVVGLYRKLKKDGDTGKILFKTPCLNVGYFPCEIEVTGHADESETKAKC